MSAALPEGREQLPAPLREALLVLVVDDVPENLALLHDALDESGYTVLVATDGASALQRAQQARPDIVLLDAVMPGGLDGFEVARRLKADARTASIPIVFMTGLTETEHLVAALEAGGSDYVTKPLKPREVLARMQVHLRGAHQARQASQSRRALDAFGYASLSLRARDGRLLWQTPLARELLQRYGGLAGELAPAPLWRWLQQQLPLARAQQEPPPLRLLQGSAELLVRLHQRLDAEPDAPASDEEEWLLVMHERNDTALIEQLGLSLALTAREAEVLYWVVKGKINRDIADIIGASPATVKKHLERIHAKLGVETRTAAATLALQRMRQLHPGWT